MNRFPTQSEIEYPNVELFSEYSKEGLNEILIYAIGHQNNEIVQLALEYGANPNANYIENSPFSGVFEKFMMDATIPGTPIEHAVYHNNSIALRHLMNYGGKVVETSAYFQHRCPVVRMCQQSKLECLDEYIKTMKHIDMPINHKYSNSLIGFAIQFGNKDLYDFLISRGAHKRGYVFNGSEYVAMPNVFSILFKRHTNLNTIIDMLTFLESRGVSMDRAIYDYLYPYELAMKSEHRLAILKHMASRGINFERSNHHAIFSAIESGDEATIHYIIEHSTNINVKTTYGDSPIDIALKNENFAIIPILLEKGVEFNYETAISYSVKDKTSKVIDIFFQHQLKRDGLKSLWNLS